MNFIRKRKGIVLVVVGVLVLLFAVAEATLFSIIKYRIENLQTWLDSMKAYYLLESAFSVALVDIKKGKIGTGSDQWVERDVDIPMGDETYKVRYRVEKESGRWFVNSSIDSPLNLDRVYYLRLGGARAFPFFIR